MDWSDALNDLTEAVLATFGSAVSVVVGPDEIGLTGIRDNPYTGAHTEELPFATPDHRFTVESAEFATTGARVGAELVINDVRYVLTDIVPDDGGMTALIVRPMA